MSGLNNSTLILYAAKCYDNVNCASIEEFENDLNIIVHIKKLMSRYANNGSINYRLLLNHFICFFNVFSIPGAYHILFFKIDRQYWPMLKTILDYLNRCPDTLQLNKEIIDVCHIETDYQLLEKLSAYE